MKSKCARTGVQAVALPLYQHASLVPLLHAVKLCSYQSMEQRRDADKLVV